MAVKYTICVILMMIKLGGFFLTEFYEKTLKGDKVRHSSNTFKVS